MSTNHSSPGRAALLDGGEGVAAARGDGVGVAAATPTELVAQQLGSVSRAPAQLELASCHAPCATPPDLRVRGFVVVEEVERVCVSLALSWSSISACSMQWSFTLTGTSLFS